MASNDRKNERCSWANPYKDAFFCSVELKYEILQKEGERKRKKKGETLFLNFSQMRPLEKKKKKKRHSVTKNSNNNNTTQLNKR